MFKLSLVDFLEADDRVSTLVVWRCKRFHNALSLHM